MSNDLLNDIYGLKDDLLPNESISFINCPNCSHNTVFYKFDPESFNYNEWEAKKDYETESGPKHARLRIKDAVIYSKQLFIHPNKVFYKLTSSYYSAWSWDACTEIALDNLRLKCKSCGFNMEYLKFEYIGNQNENSK